MLALTSSLMHSYLGMHCLELAKVAWNNIAKRLDEDDEDSTVKEIVTQVSLLLLAAKGVLEPLGQEGDEGGPLEEIKILQELVGGVRPV